MNPEYPRLRWPLDIQRIVHQGTSSHLIRDPQELAPDSIIVPDAFMAIAARFDGRHSIDMIAEEGARYGVTKDHVTALIRDLDNYNLLENDRTNALWQEMKTKFARQTERELALADAVYPRDPDKLHQTINGYLVGASSDIRSPAAKHVWAVASPHIDYQRGWRTYGAIFNALQNIDTPDVIILMGTSHQPGENLFRGASKDFATGFGTMPAAREAIELIAVRYGRKRLFDDEILHKREHSLELQLPFIGYRFGQTKLPAIVPILVGSFHPFVERNEDPRSVAEFADFVGALQDVVALLQRQEKKILFFAGVDLAHVGRHFGDPQQLAPAGLGEIETRDREFLAGILSGDLDRVFSHVVQDCDRRRLCGFPTLFTMVAAMQAAGISTRGNLVEYRQAVEPETDCTVTFAGAYWAETADSITAPI